MMTDQQLEAAAPRHFQCGGCHRAFVSKRPEKEVQDERAANGWADMPNDDMARVCDDCYGMVMEDAGR